MSPSPDVPNRPDHVDDDALHRRALDELASHALGEPLDPELTVHVDTCPRCQDELAAYRATVALARIDGPGASDLPGPAPHVWTRILADLERAEPQADTTAAAPNAAPVHAVPGHSRTAASRRTRWVTRGLLAAATVVVAGAVGWTLGDRHATENAGIASAQLAAQHGTAATAHGRATMRSSSDGFEMHVTTAGLPAPHGYYEVWLYDPSANLMVAIGTLGTDAMGTFTVPAGIDTHAYHVVDVSDQRYNGDPTHQASVLRGALVQ